MDLGKETSHLLSILKARLIFPLLLVSVLSACSYNFLYTHLDTILPVYINSMVELDELDDLVDREVVSFLAWHQKDQLPKYTSWLSATSKPQTAKPESKPRCKLITPSACRSRVTLGMR